MSPGRPLRWRLLSPLAVLLWIVFNVGRAGAAQAHDPTGPAHSTAAGHARSDVPAGSKESAGSDLSADSDVSTPSSATTPDAKGSSHASHTPAAPNTSARGGKHAGELTSPQPISNADANSGGANGQCPGGPYCSTRDGSASQNGNGGGAATGKPCAGCVGKADNKNPHGQMPNASDHNAGYECDTNHGIARGNPAHTACAPAPPACVPTETNPCVSPPECVPTDTMPCAPPTTVVSPPLPPQAAPPVTAVVSPPTGALPNTGAAEDLPWLAGAALLAIATGIGLLARRRGQAGS
jgi:LPXTG-motif cell wall-anchored protein